MESGITYLINKRKGCVGDKIKDYPPFITIVLPTSKMKFIYDMATRTIQVDKIMNCVDIKELNRMVTDLVYYDAKDFVIVRGNKLVHDKPYVL